MVRALALAVAAAVLAGAPAGCRRRTRPIDKVAAARLFDRVTLDTGGVHGLSGLAVDDAGAVWAVAERGSAAFRVVLDGSRVKSIERVEVTGVPGGEDLEALAIAGARFWIGTEGRQQGTAR